MSGVFKFPDPAQISAIAARAQPRTVSPMDPKPRAFSVGEKSLIRRVHGYMPAQQLLGVLNERLLTDQPNAVQFSLEQLYAEIGAAADAVPAGGHDWSSLRKLVANARRSGVLDSVTRQLIDDFAVVYSLSSGQVLRLHDVLLQAKEGDE